jgi:hypothetical protein
VPSAFIDLDGPLLCSEDPYKGGSRFIGPGIIPSTVPGLGIGRIVGAEQKQNSAQDHCAAKITNI